MIFNLPTVLMVLVSALITFSVAMLGTRGAVSGKPTGMQNALEWLVEFIRNMVGNNMEYERGKPFVTLALTTILFIFVGNMLSIPFKIVGGDNTLWWSSPTADAHVAMTLSLTVIVLSNVFGITFQGFKTYFTHFFAHKWWLFPMHVVEEFAKTLTLGLRLFGNIFAKETLTGMLAAAGGGSLLFASLFAVPTIVWQAFGIFIGSIQAFIFTILMLAYFSQKVQPDHDH